MAGKELQAERTVCHRQEAPVGPRHLERWHSGGAGGSPRQCRGPHPPISTAASPQPTPLAAQCVGGSPRQCLGPHPPDSAAASPRPTPPAPRQHSLPSTVSQKRVFTLFIVCSSSNFNINSTWAGLFDVLFPTLASEPK